MASVFVVSDDNCGYINHGLETETRVGVVLFVDMVYTLGECLKLVGCLMWLLGQILALSV